MCSVCDHEEEEDDKRNEAICKQLMSLGESSIGVPYSPIFSEI